MFCQQVLLLHISLQFIFHLILIFFFLSTDSSFNKKYISYIPPKVKLKAKDFERFEQLNPVIKGWGELGNPVNLTEETEEMKRLFKTFAFNKYISDRISPNRTLPDVKPPKCNYLNLYNLKDFGTASVIIIFTNEAWSVLIRTIWSVINRSPSYLLKEIILVDDFSSYSELKSDLDKYCYYYFKNLVRIIRTKQREGLIRARIMGAKEATGDVIVFLDSHCEV